MALQTDLNVSPYFDDYDQTKDFYRILFRPGVAVQARELNQLQTILQSQIERFGDNIFRRGTVIEGCNIMAHPVLPYVKIKDVQTNEAPVNVTEYEGLHVKNSTNLSAQIIKVVSGFESQAPNLNTLYVKYNNSGDSATETAFTESQVLTVYSPTYPIFSISVSDGSANFTNTDSVVVVSAIAIQNLTGGTTFANAAAFAVNDTVRNGVANATVIEYNTTANSEAVILRIKPLAIDLKTANSVLWRFALNEQITSVANTSVKAKIVGIVGTGAEGVLLTDTLGSVDAITVTNQGAGYYVPPTVAVSITSNSTISTSDVNQFAANAQNFLHNITVGNTAQLAIGSGYGATVSDGIIYQKGFFSRVSSQLVVVNKYSNTGFNKSVGFYTEEDIVDSNEDTTLLDNATGTYNYAAPGANRLKLTPTLISIDKNAADANTEFLPIVEYSEGIPYKQQNQTIYSIIGDEIAKRTYEQSGNYVLNQFNLTTKDEAVFANTANYYKLYIDPGIAYIRGKRVEYTGAFQPSVSKATTYSEQTSTVTLGYGNYVTIKELGGVFQFNTAARVDLYDTASKYITNGIGSITASGTRIGYARMRSLVLDSGEPGTPEAAYKLYLFDVIMDSGKSFNNVRSVYYNGTNKGIADVVLQNSATVRSDVTLTDTTGVVNLTNHVLSNGSLVKLFSILTTTGLTENKDYYVVQTTTSAFKLALSSNGTPISFTTNGSAIAEYVAGSPIVSDIQNSSLLYKGVNAMRHANNIVYNYRTIDQTLQSNTIGKIAVAATSGESFPYTVGANLNSFEKKDIIVIPRANYQAAAFAAGSLTVNSACTTITGSGTAFLSSFAPGDFVKVANTSAALIVQVASVLTDTSLILTKAPSANMTANAVLYYPNNVPLSLTTNPPSVVERRPVAYTNTGTPTITISMGNNVANASFSNNTVTSSIAANVSVTYNARKTLSSPVSKASWRSAYSRILVSNNAAGVAGPWPLGAPDVYRLRGIYSANSAQLTTTFFSNSTGISSNRILVTNNRYANGDSIVYTQNTSTVGLGNANTYYVVFGNNTGFSLSATRGGANVSLTANGDYTHSVIGYPLYFTPNTYGVSDITNDFYIDANQTEDYLNTSYLYRKPTVTSVGTNNDGYLVVYDAFTTTSGVKTISSYPVYDGINLTSLVAGANVHTMEIPELISRTGKYYDLRDQYDFRPTSANTITLANASVSYTDNTVVNPVESSADTRFTASEYYFPAPGSVMTASISNYLPRNDRIVMDINGNIKTITGVPGINDYFPAEPDNCITIQSVRVPAYPSIPSSVSEDMSKIIDTGLANENYNIGRKNNFTIRTILNQKQVARIQNKNYTMSDIGALEKRIDALEYYVSFTLAEAVAKSRFIPSSLYTSIDRFKFGFFVDPFTDYSRTETTHPELYCEIADDQLGPKRTNFNIQFVPETGDINSILTLPYNEFELISQNDATDGPVVVANTTGTTTGTTSGTTNTAITTVTQTIASIVQAQRTATHNDGGAVYEDFYYKFSSLTGPVEFYFNSRDNNNALEFSQSLTENGTYSKTHDSAVALLMTQKMADGDPGAGQENLLSKGVSDLNDGRKIENNGALNRKGTGPFGGWIEDGWYKKFTYDPDAGEYARIRIYKGDNHGGNGKAGTFGFKMFYPTDTVTTTTIDVGTSSSQTFAYVGTVTAVEPPNFNLSQIISITGIDITSGATVSGIYVADSQKFTITINGLKPSTSHAFYFNNVDESSKCVQVKTFTTTATLQSDANGVLKFDFYYDAGVDEATTDLQQQNKLLAAAAGIKSFVIKSSDETSRAAGSITMNYYASALNNTTSTTSLNTTSGVTSGTTTIIDQQNDYTQTITNPDTTPTTTIDPNIINTNWDAVIAQGIGQLV